MVAIANYMARNGATVPEIAKELGVSERKVYDWYKEHPEFLQSVKEGRLTFDQRVLSSLGQRAVGYTYETEKVFSNGFRATVTEHVPADVGAAINWLVNRQGWRRGDNVVQDAMDATATAPAGEPPNTRQLALAAMALLGAAVHQPEPDAKHQTVDVTPSRVYDADPNETEEPDDDTDDPDFDID